MLDFAKPFFFFFPSMCTSNIAILLGKPNATLVHMPQATPKKVGNLICPRMHCSKLHSCASTRPLPCEESCLHKPSKKHTRAELCPLRILKSPVHHKQRSPAVQDMGSKIPPKDCVHSWRLPQQFSAVSDRCSAGRRLPLTNMLCKGDQSRLPGGSGTSRTLPDTSSVLACAGKRPLIHSSPYLVLGALQCPGLYRPPLAPTAKPCQHTRQL